jgi:ribonuclease HI
MSVPAPHFLLYSQAALASRDDSPTGRWRFVLRRPGSEESLEAADEEPETSSERLELLAIIRGLEALGERSRVTLVAPSRYVQRGLEFGLSQWRESDWQWERYGRMTPVKNSDLWRRLARLVEIHTVQCRPGRLNQADDLAPARPRPEAGSIQSETRGRKLRFDQPGGKSESRSTKHETNSKHQCQNDRNSGRFRHLSLDNWSLFRVSCCVLRALRRWTAIGRS